MAQEQDAAFVEYVVKQLVENTDAVKTERTVDEMGVLIQLTVDPKDMGRVIGKEGRTAKALRTLLRVLGAKNNARVNLKIMEPEGGEVRMDDNGDEVAAPRASRSEKSNDDAATEPEPMVEAEEPEPAAPKDDEQQATEVL